jgi:hypothetical protein
MGSQESTRKLLSDTQIRLLSKMVHRALVEIRGLENNGDAEQAADLADAFHNLPVFMFSDDFDWSVARRFLEDYLNKYSLPRAGSPFDYLTFLDKIQEGADDFD